MEFLLPKTRRMNPHPDNFTQRIGDLKNMKPFQSKTVFLKNVHFWQGFQSTRGSLDGLLTSNMRMFDIKGVTG